MTTLCHHIVIRDCNEDACNALAVTFRDDDPESPGPWPVCRRHAGPSTPGVLWSVDPARAERFAPGWLVGAAAAS